MKQKAMPAGRQGFIKIILLIVMALIVLSFFDVRIVKIRSIFESSIFKENINYILEAVEKGFKQMKDLL